MLKITVDPCAGTAEETCREMVRLANALDVAVEAMLCCNRATARPGDDPDELEAGYRRQRDATLRMLRRRRESAPPTLGEVKL